MKICFIDREAAHSIWSLIDVIAKKLIDDGHQVVYCRFCDQSTRTLRKTPPSVRVQDIAVGQRMNSLSIPLQALKFKKKLKPILLSEKFDVVHTNFALPGNISRKLAKNMGVPLVVTTHHELFGSMNLLLKCWTFSTGKYCDVPVYISDTVKNSYRLIKNHNFKVIKNGVDINVANNFINSSQDVQDPPIFTCVGRLSKVKGQSIVIRAFSKILKHVPKSKLYIIGDGPDKKYLQNLALNLGIDSNVIFTGWVSKNESLRYIKNSSVLLIASDGTQEGFGLVLAEAMTLKTPIICSKIPVFEEVAASTVTFFDVGSDEDLANKALILLSDYKKAKLSTILAFERVQQYFNQEIMAAEYSKIYLEGVRNHE